jgi:hypothetical protein
MSGGGGEKGKKELTLIEKLRAGKNEQANSDKRVLAPTEKRRRRTDGETLYDNTRIGLFGK